MKIKPFLAVLVIFAFLLLTAMKEPQRYIQGYPEIFYGYKPWIDHGTNGKLPKRTKELGNIEVTLNYSLWHERNLFINLVMKAWITAESKTLRSFIWRTGKLERSLGAPIKGVLTLDGKYLNLRLG